VELRLEAEESKETVLAQVAELETQIAGLQAARKRIQRAGYVCGVVTLAAIIVIVIMLI
jgi:type IV secretory pathway component VirB8